MNGVNRVLSGHLLRNVLRKLHADASDQEHFTRVGAFRSLLPDAARESYRAVMANGRDYRVWRFRDEVIVGLLGNWPAGILESCSGPVSSAVRCRRGRGAGARNDTHGSRGLARWGDGRRSDPRAAVPVPRAVRCRSLLAPGQAVEGTERAIVAPTLSANMTETPATFGITAGRWR